MPGEDIYSWSITAADNGTADTSINFAEGQPRASVNNSARGMMAAHAKSRNLLNGSITTSGTANAQIFTSDVTYITVPTGMRVLLKIGPGLTNTGAATLKMDGAAAVAIKTQLGTDVAAGDLTAGSYADFVYDGTNWVLRSGGQSFPTATLMLFQQTAAPTGWTKQTTHNDKALRIVSGTASSGGSIAFSTVFARQATDSHVLSIPEMPAHIHSLQDGLGILADPGSSYGLAANTPGGSLSSGATGGSGGHTHNIDIRVQYVDVIIASKD